MAIWFRTATLQQLNALGRRGLAGTLHIEFTEIGEDFLAARLPVNDGSRQPGGILHGGANVVLAETIASVGAACVIDPEKFRAVGLEINANHLAAASDGYVAGIGRPIHLGRTTQVWEIRITNAQGRLSCISRCTMAILEGGYKL